MSEYNLDEAHRIVGVTSMHNGQTYVFDVHNTAGQFTVTMKEHHLQSGFLWIKRVCCRHMNDPCAVTHKNLKDALWESIELHEKLAHRLKVIT